MWNSFESAPKDGREILVCYPSQGNVKQLVSWDKLHDCWDNKGKAELGLEAQGCLWLDIPAVHDPNPSLYLHGKCSDHIWLMEDGPEPHILGIRMDCGDSGVVYLTREQAADLEEQLKSMRSSGRLWDTKAGS
jgi:hypothetical protein